MPIDLILSGNGPGELTGWIAPVAQAARSEARGSLRLTLALTPSQFAGGRELEVVRGWNLFDQILDPRQCIRLALGLSPPTRPDRGVLVHLGGDLWISGRLAARLRVSACAFAETTLITRRHPAFARIFASSESLAGALRARGVPAHKVLVSGDPRVDAFALAPDRGRSPTGPSIAFLPGSRDRFFRVLAPYFAEAGARAAERIPGLLVRVVASPFLSPTLVDQIRRDVAQQWPAVRWQWVAEDLPQALAASDLVVTIPGTNTMELGMIGAAFVVLLPLQAADLVPFEGVLDWAARVPGVGPVLRRAVVSRYLARGGLLALPNLRGGRRIVPEWVGQWTPAELAMRIADLHADRPALDRMRADLTALRPSPGASRVIVHQALALA